MLIRRELERFFGALGFFTRLPVPSWVGHTSAALDRSARYFPAVGLLVGLIGALVYIAAAWFWPKTLAVLLSMAATVLVTGAFHEDGLADTLDGLGGGWDKARILEIMKDSRIGSFGVTALVLALLSKFMTLVELREAWLPAALIAGHGVSRLAATSLLATMAYVRDDAQARAKPVATRLGRGDLAIAAAFALAGLLLLPPGRTLIACVLAALVTAWMARLFRRRLGGYTGDCLGATQQVAEIAFYLGLVAGLPQ